MNTVQVAVLPGGAGPPAIATTGRAGSGVPAGSQQRSPRAGARPASAAQRRGRACLEGARIPAEVASLRSVSQGI